MNGEPQSATSPAIDPEDFTTIAEHVSVAAIVVGDGKHTSKSPLQASKLVGIIINKLGNPRVWNNI